MVNSVITLQRLLQLATGYPNLKTSWYLVASTALSACNRPKEIPKILYMLMQQDFKMGTANDIIEWVNTGKLIPANKEDPLIILQLQDSILKSLVITGLPKLINLLMLIRDSVKEPAVKHRDFQQDQQLLLQRGEEHFKLIYNKVTNKVSNNLKTSYPDLYYFIIQNCYGLLLNYSTYVSDKDTSLAIIGSLVPQDVNLQLKGHMKGAFNVGNSVLECNEALQLLCQVTEWCHIELTEMPYHL